MKAQALQLIFTLFLSVLFNTTIAATFFNPADAGANTVEFGFDTFDEDLTPGDGNFSAAGGKVRTHGFIGFGDQGITEPFAYSGLGSQLDFTFADPVSAFGFNFAFDKNVSFIFSIFDSSNSQIESFTVDPLNFGLCDSTTFFVCGFIGLDVDSNQISSAVFSLFGFSNFGPIVDNVIYGTVPTPGILWLLSTGFLGLYWNRKRNLA